MMTDSSIIHTIRHTSLPWTAKLSVVMASHDIGLA